MQNTNSFRDSKRLKPQKLKILCPDSAYAENLRLCE